MRAWPPSDACFACESSSRAFSRGAAAASAKAPNTKEIAVVAVRSIAVSLLDEFYRHMTVASQLGKIFLQEDINFLLSNRIPRQLATRFIGRFSQIENPLLASAAIAIWRLFTELDLSDSQTRRFESVHACFTRKLKDGARPIDPDPRVMTSPCDAIVGASGPIRGDELMQVKGFPYTLRELLIDPRVRRALCRWTVRDAASDLGHVPPLPCAP